MYKLITWTPDIDVDMAEFYAEASRRNFENNASRKMLVDSISNSNRWCVWILYCDERIVGTAAAHSLPELGDSAYRICARTCVLTNWLDGVYGSTLRTKNVIIDHQNPTAQFFIPAQIEWAGPDADLYISTNSSEIASQRSVNNTFARLLEKTEVLKLTTTKEYRGHLQNFWKLNTNLFLEQLNQKDRWEIQ
jgi:hypothetical protein